MQLMQGMRATMQISKLALHSVAGKVGFRLAATCAMIKQCGHFCDHCGLPPANTHGSFDCPLLSQSGWCLKASL